MNYHAPEISRRSELAFFGVSTPLLAAILSLLLIIVVIQRSV